MATGAQARGGRSWSSSALAAFGVALSVVAALVPGWVLDQRAAERLDKETSAVGDAISAQMNATTSRLERSARGLHGVPLDPTGFSSTLVDMTAPESLVTSIALVGTIDGGPALDPADIDTSVGISQLVRFDPADGKVTDTRTSMSRSTPDTVRALGLQWPPTRRSVRLIAYPVAKLPGDVGFPVLDSADGVAQGTAGAVRQSGLVLALVVSVPNTGWFIAPLQPSRLQHLLERRPLGRSMRITLDTGDGSTRALVAEVRGSDSTELGSRTRRAVHTVSIAGLPISITAEAPARFATGSGPSPVLVFVGGLGLTAGCIVLMGRARYRHMMEQQHAELLQARVIARTDALTGLGNRLALSEWLDELMDDHQRACVLLCDLDRFKIINDARGHEAGDDLLVQVGERVSQAAPRGRVARFGGDEFVVVLPDVGVDEALDVAETILSSVRRPFTLGTDSVVLGASVGLASSETAAQATRSSLLRDADVAMFSAKRSGGNRIAVANDELRHEGAGQLDLELELRTALGTGQLRTWYQPIVDRTGVIRSLEALVRWQHPSRGLVSPGLFLPAAKQAGLLAELSTMVLSRACDDVARWNLQRVAQGMAPVVVHVNCVEDQLLDPGYPDVVGAYLQASGIDPAALLLEISEETALDRLPKGLPTLHQLRALGIRFSLDDFGFGNSSLTMVRELGDVAEIKLDKSIVDNVASGAGTGDEADVAVARAVIGFAKAQGISIVAEGIEEEAQWTALAAMGADLFQGYFFHRPMPAEQVEQLLLATAVVAV